MKLHAAHPGGWAIFEAQAHADERGWVAEILREDALRAHAGELRVVQQNLSMSRRGVLRGMHYQLESPQGKLVQVLRGRIHDVIVDLRRDSPDFGRSFAIRLSGDSLQSLWAPPGFAHGFLAMEDSTVLYSLTQPRIAAAERAIRWNCPQLGIEWPLAAGQEPIISERDRAAPVFGEAEVYGK